MIILILYQKTQKRELGTGNVKRKLKRKVEIKQTFINTFMGINYMQIFTDLENTNQIGYRFLKGICDL
jgi:hypothetical protein